MPEDEQYQIVSDDEWCDFDEAASCLERARQGASLQVDWDVFMIVANRDGHLGYYWPEINNEATWQATSSSLRRASRTIARSVGKVLNFVFSVGWN